jgi:Protein of unknown function (DUF421)
VQAGSSLSVRVVPRTFSGVPAFAATLATPRATPRAGKLCPARVVGARASWPRAAPTGSGHTEAGRPEVLIHNGRLFESVLSDAKLTHHELDAALRQAGCTCVEDVHSAILENNGSISVTPRTRQATTTGQTPHS